MKMATELAERVRRFREGVGLSQQDLAVRAGLSLSQVSKLEQGKKADPRASTVLVLAAALGVRPGELLDELPLPEAKKRDQKKPVKKKRKKPRKRRKAPAS